MNGDYKLEENKEKKTVARKTTARKTKAAVKKENTSDASSSADSNVAKKAEKKTPKKRVTIPKDREFVVKSGTVGTLVVRTRDNDIDFTLENGDEIYLTYEELQKVRRTSKKYFTNGWLIVEGDDEFTPEMIYASLHVDDSYVSKYQSPETLDFIFDLPKSELKKEIEKVPEGFKETIANRAQELILTGDIDSLSKINTLSELLDVEFDEA